MTRISTRSLMSLTSVLVLQAALIGGCTLDALIPSVVVHGKVDLGADAATKGPTTKRSAASAAQALALASQAGNTPRQATPTPTPSLPLQAIGEANAPFSDLAVAFNPCPQMGGGTWDTSGPTGWAAVLATPTPSWQDANGNADPFFAGELSNPDGDFLPMSLPSPVPTGLRSLKTTGAALVTASPGPVQTPRPVASILPESAPHNLPRVLVIIPEIHICGAGAGAANAPDPAGESEVLRLFHEAGYPIVDPGQTKKARITEVELARLRNPSQVAALGRENDAEIVVIGEAFSETASNAGGQLRILARVEARAIRTDTAEILAVDGKEAQIQEVSEMIGSKRALKAAGSLLAKSLIGQMASRTHAAALRTIRVEILISGVDFPTLTVLLDQIRGLKGMVRVTQRNFDADLARIEIDADLAPTDLFSAIANIEIAGKHPVVTKATTTKAELVLR